MKRQAGAERSAPFPGHALSGPALSDETGIGRAGCCTDYLQVRLCRGQSAGQNSQSALT